MEAYEGLSDVYERKGDYVNALEMHHQYALIKDTIYSETSAQEIAEAQEKYESEKKQKELELLQKDNEINQIKFEKNKNYLYFTLFIILAIIIILAFVYQQFRIKKRSNLLLEEQNNLIGAQKKEITDSINYASIIQRAMLPLPSEFNAHFPKNFIYYQPKDIVSGDFYWCSERNNLKAIVVADCTGHGVPGAMMSMVGNNLLNQAFNDLKLNSPSQILEFLDQGVSKNLHQHTDLDSAKNSMDLCFCLIDENNHQLIYGGSMNSIYVISQNQLSVLKTDKVPIGYQLSNSPKIFNSYTHEFKKGDKIYLASDGIQDQFGGPQGKKLMTKKLREFLLTIHHFPMQEQYHQLNKLIMEWKGNYEQTDDMLLIGIEL
jgi:serine phosphatase RsbU (regulator of sigma subunit)